MSHYTSLCRWKELEILIIITIAILKRKNIKCGKEDFFKLVKGSLETVLTIEKFNKCYGELISSKSLKHKTINSREFLSIIQLTVNSS